MPSGPFTDCRCRCSFGSTLLTEKQILAWADAHRAARGKWPVRLSGPIPGTRESWSGVDSALNVGRRGLPGGSSLARLLAKRRGVRNLCSLPPLNERQILAWAKSYHKATGRWPKPSCGPVAQSPGNTWTAVCVALAHGLRGLPGGSSLTKLLRNHRLK